MKLKKPKRFRWTRPRVCGFCKWFQYCGDGSALCIRDPEDLYTGWDTGDAQYYQQVCDRFAQVEEGQP